MKLTDKQKKEIITEYVSGGTSQRELAKRYQTTQKTISKILNDEKVYQSISNIKEQNTLSMLAFMESRTGQAQELIALALDSVKGKLSKASLKDTMTAIEKLSTLFKDGGNDNNGDNANELRIVVEKKVVDLTKGEDDDDTV